MLPFKVHVPSLFLLPQVLLGVEAASGVPTWELSPQEERWP